MFEKIINVITSILIICLAVQCIRQVWNPNKEEEEERKEEENK